MSRLRSFFDFVQAFELAWVTDDFDVLGPFFEDDAEHVVVDGGPQHDRHDRGRAEVVRGLHDAVRTHDHRFDVRLPEIVEGPLVRDDGVWMRFRLTTRRAGLPDLSIEGEHLVRYRGDRIVAIEERVLQGAAETERFLREHEAALRPVGAGPCLPSGGRDLADLNSGMMRSLVRCYGAAKSAQDIPAALSVCHESFSIETVCFGIASRDREETAAHLALFFDAFPDYGVRIEGLAAEGEHASLWGHARMTLDGASLGVPATGRTAELPIFCVFAFRDGRLAHETFFFDLPDLCRQLGVPLAEFERALGTARAAA